MKYAKIYCELKASLSADKAKLKIIKCRIEAYSHDYEANEEVIKKLKEDLKIQEEIVYAEKAKLTKLESELKRMSSDLDDVELKVFTLHYIKGYKLNKVAKKLFLSHDRIKRISMLIQQKIKV